MQHRKSVVQHCVAAAAQRISCAWHPASAFRPLAWGARSPRFQGVKPEDRAREEIDRQLTQCSWLVQDQATTNIMAGPGVAVREFKLKSGHGRADYLLYADGKVIGVIEAKPAGYTLTGVELQSAMYTEGLPDGIPHHHLHGST